MNAHTSFEVYNPSKSLGDRIKRRLIKYQARRPLKLNLKHSIISLSFDDCPRSVFETALPAMEKRGWRGTIYAAMGLCDTTNHFGLHMSAQNLKSAYEAGHEIADHTFSHLDAKSVSTTDFMKDIERNQAALSAMGIPSSRTFAYPYGEVSYSVKTALSERFELSRGIHSPNSTNSLDLNQTPSQRLYSGPEFQICRNAIHKMTKTPTWLILFTHDVRANPSAYGCTPEEFEIILQDIEKCGAKVLPVIEALDKIRGLSS